MKKLWVLTFILLAAAGCSNDESLLLKKAEKLHDAIITIDTHCDTPIGMARTGFDPGVRHDEGCVDFPRMNEGGLDAEFFAVFIGQGPRDDSTLKIVDESVEGIFKVLHQSIEKNTGMAGLATSPGDAQKLKKEDRIAVFIGLENGYAIGRDASLIKKYYDLGARYITLCHTKNNDICDSSTDSAGSEHDGISEFGKEVIKEMNRLGMMIDVSHISDKSFYDVINLSKAPVIASHSSCRALCESPRNLSDDMLLALKENGGVIQICILSEYIKTPGPNPELDAKIAELQSGFGDIQALSEEERTRYRTEYRAIREKYRKLATVSDVVDHIDHVVQVIGVEHVGIGTDFDGGGGVDGCRSVAEMKNITIELLRRGYSKSDIEKIWGGNFLRVFSETVRTGEKI